MRVGSVFLLASLAGAGAVVVDDESAMIQSALKTTGDDEGPFDGVHVNGAKPFGGLAPGVKGRDIMPRIPDPLGVMSPYFPNGLGGRQPGGGIQPAQNSKPLEAVAEPKKGLEGLVAKIFGEDNNEAAVQIAPKFKPKTVRWPDAQVHQLSPGTHYGDGPVHPSYDASGRHFGEGGGTHNGYAGGRGRIVTPNWNGKCGFDGFLNDVHPNSGKKDGLYLNQPDQCERIRPGYPDLRGFWIGASDAEKPEAEGSTYEETIEQCGDRVLTHNKDVVRDIVHADGTLENGVSDYTWPKCDHYTAAAEFNVEAKCLVVVSNLKDVDAERRCVNGHGPHATLVIEWAKMVAHAPQWHNAKTITLRRKQLTDSYSEGDVQNFDHNPAGPMSHFRYDEDGKMENNPWWNPYGPIMRFAPSSGAIRKGADEK